MNVMDRPRMSGRARFWAPLRARHTPPSRRDSASRLRGAGHRQVGPVLPGKGGAHQRGQSLLEFALVLPLLLLLIIFLITIPGFSAWDLVIANNVAEQVAQDGADAYATGGAAAACSSKIIAEAQQQLQQSGLALQNLKVTCRVTNTANINNRQSYGVEGTRQVSITISFSVRVILPGAAVLSFSVTSSARIEGVLGP